MPPSGRHPEGLVRAAAQAGGCRRAAVDDKAHASGVVPRDTDARSPASELFLCPLSVK